MEAIARNFLIESIIRLPNESITRRKAFEVFNDVTKTPWKLDHLMSFIETNGMYPFNKTRKEKVCDEAKMMSKVSKEEKMSILKKTKFCTNPKHINGYMGIAKIEMDDCMFAHTIDEYNPPTCFYKEYCSNPECNLNHGLSKEEWIEYKDIKVPIRETKTEFCRNVKHKRPCPVENCPWAHSIWEMNSSVTKGLSDRDLLYEISYFPSWAYRDTNENNHVKFITLKQDKEQKEQEWTEEYIKNVKDNENTVPEEEEEEDEEENDEDEIEIVIGDSLSWEEIAKQKETFEFEMEQYGSSIEDDDLIHDDYVTTMSLQLCLPKTLIYKMVLDGKTDIVEKWLDRLLLEDLKED